MRRMVVATALLLAGCGGGDDAGNDVAANIAVPGEETPVAEASPSVLTQVPVRFAGTWDRDVAACRAEPRGEYRLVIARDTLRFHESVARVTAATEVGDGSVDVDAIANGEGMTEQRRYRLTLAEGGAIEVTVGGTTARRVRCDAPAAASAAGLTLAADGIAVGAGRPIAFGSPQATMLRAAEAATRALPKRGRNEECGAGPLDYADYPGIRLWSQDGRFVGWDARGRTLRTAAGIGIGSTRAALTDVVAATIEETSLGTEFNAGTLSGLLEGEGDAAVVTAMWAGTTCVFR